MGICLLYLTPPSTLGSVFTTHIGAGAGGGGGGGGGDNNGDGGIPGSRRK